MYFHRFDINSPDSGIHSDARSDDGSHVHGPVNEDIYSVVNKSSEPEGSEETTPTGVFKTWQSNIIIYKYWLLLPYKVGVFSIKYSGLGLICLNHVSLVLYVKHSIEKAQLYICPIEWMEMK